MQGERATFVVIAANRQLPRLQTIVPLDRLRPFLNEKDTVELTDDHVPVDQLLAPVYGDSLEEHGGEADSATAAAGACGDSYPHTRLMSQEKRRHLRAPASTHGTQATWRRLPRCTTARRSCGRRTVGPSPGLTSAGRQ